MKRPGHLFPVVIAAACAASLLGCPGSADPAGPGEACFRALDCQDGLVCIEGRCTADITPIVPGAPAPARTGDPDPDPEPEPEADAGPY